ncbi:MAG TPA: hypothetical protein DDZ51_07980 [Planctomycetaceae bacterium]|nr:hypothetical protein [Planctomycetaceae bacterium]
MYDRRRVQGFAKLWVSTKRKKTLTRPAVVGGAASLFLIKRFRKRGFDAKTPVKKRKPGVAGRSSPVLWVGASSWFLKSPFCG